MEKFLKKIVLCFIVISVIFSGSFPFSIVFAAANTVTSVDVEGISKVEKNTVLKTIRTTAGSPYSTQIIHEDIKSLYALGVFQDIEVDKDDKSGGIKIIFRVKEKPSVSKITIIGNKEISTEKIKPEILQKQYQILDEKKVSQSKEKVKVMQKAVEQADENNRLMDSRFRNSLVTLSDLLDANSILLQSKINLALAKADVQLAYYRLQKSTGTIQ